MIYVYKGITLMFGRIVYSFTLREAAKKCSLFSGPNTKALRSGFNPPPPTMLVVRPLKRELFRGFPNRITNLK